MKKFLCFFLAMITAILCFSGCRKAPYFETVPTTEGEEGEPETCEPTVEDRDGPGEEEEEGPLSGQYDMEYVFRKGTFTVGITAFPPMITKGTGNTYTGFDAELAILFGNSLGVEVEFVPIMWIDRFWELENGDIDCLWCGMTKTDAIDRAFTCSNAYCRNTQVIVVPKDKAARYSKLEKCKDLNFVAVTGSAGADELDKAGYVFTPVVNQETALEAVSTGKADAAVVDGVMASVSVGDGTKNPGLAAAAELTDEVYAVGFRRGSDLTEELNTFLHEAYEDGTIKKLAEKYKISQYVIPQ